MSNLKTCERLLKRSCLTNLYIPNGIAITPLLSGAHGLGKSAICRQVAKSLGGVALTVEGGSLKEGEITGLPYSETNPDGTKEVRFVKYYITSRIAAAEKEIYIKAQETGFLGGTVRLNEDGSTSYKDETGQHVIPAKTRLEKIFEGMDNEYQFGEDLPGDIKLKLLKTGEIMPVVLFIDEMNRTDSQTMKELMNIVLTRTVNGYKFPWWTFIVSAINPCGQDSVYSTNDLDAAQLDRFLKIKVNADSTEWVDYATDAGLNQDYILAVATAADEVFQTKGKGYDDTSEDDMSPTPRSHELCSYIYDKIQQLNNSGFFQPEELQYAEEDVRALIIGKLGVRAARVVLSNLKNRENFIDPAELFTGKSKTLPDKYKDKIQGMKAIARHVLVKNCIKYIASTSVKAYFDQGSKTTDQAVEAKGTWGNTISQIKQFFDLLDGATQVMFAKSVYTTQVAISDPKYAKYTKETIMKPLASVFSTEILSQVVMVSGIKTSGDIDKK